MSGAGRSDLSRGLMDNFNRLLVRPTSNAAPEGSAPSNIPPDTRVRYESMFHQHCGGKSYLSGIEAAEIFLESRLHKKVLTNIWEHADVTRDGRFTRDEFCHAMWLIDIGKGTFQHPCPPPNNVAQSHAHQDTNTWSSPPAYSPQPQQQYHPPPQPLSQSFPYGIPPPPGPPPTNPTAGYQPSHYGYAPQPAPPLEKLEMLEPMICQGCDTGLLPGDVVYNCEQCKDGVSRFCEPCYSSGRRCYHAVAPSKLEAGKELKNEDKDGDWGFGLKCDGCKTKLKNGMLCWHCKRCFDPNFCKDCWKRRDKRCKHAGQGKVQLRRVGKSSVTTEQVLDGLDTVGEILGG